MKLTTKAGRGQKLHISLDGEYALTTTLPFWAKLGWAEGAQITEEEFDRLREQVENHKAVEKAVDFLSRRDHSKKELLEKLCRTQAPEAARLAVERMEELGYINDQSYARKRARALLEEKGMAVGRIRIELIHRGIDRQWIDEALEELEADPRQQILELLTTKYARKLSDETGVRRTTNALVRLGYRWEDIRSALAAYIDTIDEE